MSRIVLGHDLEVVEIAVIERALAAGEMVDVFSVAERRYAESKTDPARRLAARWAAKRAAARVLGAGVALAEIEVLRGQGPPRLRLRGRAAERHQALGDGPFHVSLTHGLTHAAASVVLEAPSE